LGFSDFERSLGKKNVFALKTKAADQYGDFLLRLGNTPPLLQLQAEALQAGSSDPQPGSGVDAEALSPPIVVVVATKSLAKVVQRIVKVLKTVA